MLRMSYCFSTDSVFVWGFSFVLVCNCLFYFLFCIWDRDNWWHILTERFLNYFPFQSHGDHFFFKYFIGIFFKQRDSNISEHQDRYMWENVSWGIFPDLMIAINIIVGGQYTVNLKRRLPWVLQENFQFSLISNSR